MPAAAPATDRQAAGGLGSARPWTRADTASLTRPLAVVAALHVAGFGALALGAGPLTGQGTGQLLGWGLALSAYALGVRHAFDADHIAVIDGATRKLTADAAHTPGRPRPLSVGFWFSLGHSSVVLAMALLVAAGTGLAPPWPARTPPPTKGWRPSAPPPPACSCGPSAWSTSSPWSPSCGCAGACAPGSSTPTSHLRPWRSPAPSPGSCGA
nr:hypothetical protein [uncultured Pseudokineococcus sp.]